jgi:type IV secretion system protein TrbF
MSAAPKLTHYEDDLMRSHNSLLRTGIYSLFGANVLLAGALVLVARQPRNRPYVVEVNTKGEPTALAQPLTGNPIATQDAVTKWLIQQFISNARTVTPDIAQQKEHLFNAYAFVRQQGYDELEAYYHDPQVDRIPFDIAKKSWVQVSNVRVLKLPIPDTYQADWDETRTDYNTTAAQPSSWRATMKVATDTPTDRNPIGLYITTLDWAEEAR